MRESGLLAEKGGTDDSAFNSSQGNVIGKSLTFCYYFRYFNSDSRFNDELLHLCRGMPVSRKRKEEGRLIED